MKLRDRPGLEIVEASTQEHFRAMSLIHAQGWRAAYRDAVPADWMAEHITDDRWVETFRDYAERPRFHCFLLLDEGKPVSCITCWPARIGEQNHGGGMLIQFDASGYEGWGEVISFYTMPGETGKGYGALLMDHCLSQLRADGFRQAYLFVLRENEGARRFYAAHGFAWDGTHQDIPFPLDTVCVDLRYVKDLG